MAQRMVRREFIAQKGDIRHIFGEQRHRVFQRGLTEHRHAQHRLFHEPVVIMYTARFAESITFMPMVSIMGLHRS